MISSVNDFINSLNVSDIIFYAVDWTCLDGLEFQCSNGRCVPLYFECDGRNDCGDNSDERLQCLIRGNFYRILTASLKLEKTCAAGP